MNLGIERFFNRLPAAAKAGDDHAGGDAKAALLPPTLAARSRAGIARANRAEALARGLAKGFQRGLRWLPALLLALAISITILVLPLDLARRRRKPPAT